MDTSAIAFLRPDGSVRKRLSNQPWGLRFEPLGDLDGDGTPELATGNGVHVNIVSLDPSAVRNGSGVNPLILSQTADPVIGTTWSATLDCSGHASGLAALWGFSAPTSGSITPFGEILITGHKVFDFVQLHFGGPTLFQANVPNRVDLIDLPIFIQGACTGAPGARLSNALDVLVGK